jgi:hypothetical protein
MTSIHTSRNICLLRSLALKINKWNSGGKINDKIVIEKAPMKDTTTPKHGTIALQIAVNTTIPDRKRTRRHDHA